MDIKRDGYVLTVGNKVTRLPKTSDKYDQKTFFKELKQVKADNPKKTDAVISIEDRLPYHLLIAGMDRMIEAGFKEVGIAVGEVR